MAICANTNISYKDFKMLGSDKYFVDKSRIIDRISKRIHTKSRFLCNIKPRRFGKTSILNMLGTYYVKTCSSASIFDGLQISNSKNYHI